MNTTHSVAESPKATKTQPTIGSGMGTPRCTRGQRKPMYPRGLFDEGTLRPAAKLVGNKADSIIVDYLSTPAEMYDAEGIKTW